MIETKTISKYYLAEALEEAQDLILDGWRINPKTTYRMGTVNQIELVKELTAEQEEAHNSEVLKSWEEAKDSISAASIKDPLEKHLSTMDIHQLRAYAKENGVTIHPNMTKKGKILKKIVEDSMNSSTPPPPVEAESDDTE